eukprot:Nitzschia sp. Nitz4//scaffold70_size99833//67444//69394//NITZ4_004602-RA/size99833-snap-gene-0.135-mRNA-1//1//CDS//3329557156//4203//frame0
MRTTLFYEARKEQKIHFRFLRIFISCAILGCFPINGFLMGLPNHHLSHLSRFSSRPSPLLASSGPGNKGKFGSSRSERKARERARKLFAKGKPKSNQPKQTLTMDSTMQDLLRTVKLAETKTGIPELKSFRRFLSNNTEWESNYTQTELASLYTRAAVASLGLGNLPIVRWSLQKRESFVSPQAQFPKDSYDLVRALAKAGNLTEAWAVLDEELPVPSQNVSVTELDVKTRLKYRVKSLVSIISEYFSHDAHALAVDSCQKLAVLGPLVRQTDEPPSYWGVPWLRLVKAAAKGETLRRTGVKKDEEEKEPEVKGSTEMPCNMIYTVLNAMCTFPPNNDDLVYEAVSTALVRRVEFVKGAVTLEGCPKADRGEAAFIGRSNVGKSSLVNMITNRKSLAFTSQTPGKTQQFNFFAVNDKPGLEKEIRYGDEVEGKPDLDCFYMVDLPGFGFAVAPEQERTKWADFMKSYLAGRERLKVVFHLIDGRHGPIAEDATIMRFVSENLRKGVAYVIVLTKADKNVNKVSKVEHSGAIKGDIMTKLKDQMKENGVAKAWILITSARTRLGRLDLWRYLRHAAQG